MGIAPGQRSSILHLRRIGGEHDCRGIGDVRIELSAKVPQPDSGVRKEALVACREFKRGGFTPGKDLEFEAF